MKKYVFGYFFVVVLYIFIEFIINEYSNVDNFTFLWIFQAIWLFVGLVLFLYLFISWFRNSDDNNEDDSNN
jgi:phage shock protein PspC (stress-responsive transcriptional regulator)